MGYKDPMKDKEYYEAHKEHYKQYREQNKDKISQYGKQRYKTNKDKIIETVKQYRETHNEEINDRKRQYYQSHKNELNAKSKQYREIKKDKIKEERKEYYKTNKDKIMQHTKQYWEAHREESKEQKKQYYQNHREERKVKDKQYYETHQNEIKKYRLKHYYGITSIQFYTILKQQSYKCAICGKKINERSANVDHNHTTGAVRGLLCTQCNLNLGTYERMKNYEREIKEYVSRNRHNIIYYSKLYRNKKIKLPILLEQDNKCALCHENITFKTACVDHDHESGFVRGMLCHSCNTGLGIYEKMLKYKPILDSYLEKGNQYRLEIFATQ